MKRMLLLIHWQFDRLASARTLLLLSGLMIVLALLVISPLGPDDELRALAGGRPVPDIQPWRTAVAFYEQLDAYGAAGRRLYLTRLAPVDLFTPLVQLLFLSTAITVVFRGLLPAGSRWHYLNLLPIAALVADYLENVTVVAAMLLYPVRLDWLVPFSASFTALKMGFSVAAVALLVAGLGLRAVRRTVPRRGAP